MFAPGCHVWLILLSPVLLTASPPRARSGPVCVVSAHEPSPTSTQPVRSTDGVAAVPPGVPPDRCLEVARDHLEHDRFHQARAWYRAARARAGEGPLAKEAARRLAELAVLGRPAPGLWTGQWLRGGRPRGSRLRGKVVLLVFFQIIETPSQHAMNHAAVLAERYANRGLAVIGLVEVLGAAAVQTPDAIRRFVAGADGDHPVALDAKDARTLRAYGGDSTPYAALIDRAGRVRMVGRFRQDRVERKILALLAEEAEHRLPGPDRVMPASRGGRDRIDTRAPRLPQGIWLNTPDGRPPKLLGEVRLIRFFTDGCRYCRSTAPALNRLFEDYGGRGLRVVGIYHPKPRPRAVSPEALRRVVRRLELKIPVTADPDWAYLRKIWLETGDRHYTSVSFLIDRRGVVRYVHPGPDFFPSEDPPAARQDADYRALRRAIEKVLSE